MNMKRKKSNRSKKFRRDVQKFIKHKLKSKIESDLRNSKIITEADLQSCVYLYLRRYLKDDKRWKIFNQPHISKLWGTRKTINFFPDLVLTVTKPRISIELKAKKSVKKSRVVNDARKLYRMRKQKVIRRGYLIYVYRSKDRDYEKDLQREVDVWIKKYRYVYCMIINAYEHIPKNRWNKWTEQWEKSKHYRI